MPHCVRFKIKSRHDLCKRNFRCISRTGLHWFCFALYRLRSMQLCLPVKTAAYAGYKTFTERENIVIMDNAMQKKYYKQISIAPFVNKNSTLKTYLYIVIALIPQVIMLFITKSYDNLFLIFTCILACLFSEILYILKKKV